MLAVWALAFWPWLFAPTFGFVAIARDIEADLLWDSPSRASFGKVGSIMKRLRVPIDRHADGQITEVVRKIVLVVPCTAAMVLMPSLSLSKGSFEPIQCGPELGCDMRRREFISLLGARRRSPGRLRCGRNRLSACGASAC